VDTLNQTTRWRPRTNLTTKCANLLEDYSDYMRRESISYQDMFRKIKNALVQKKKIVRASGRDTGDGMKLSRDKDHGHFAQAGRNHCGSHAICV